MNQKLLKYAGSAVVVSTLMLPAFAGQQRDTRPTYADIREVQTLLNRPGGLELLAKRRGHFYLKMQAELFPDLSLDTLIQGNSEIALVTIQSKKSRLISSGDDIVTDYVFQPVEVFKGTFSKNDVFCAFGGKITFPNGTSAEISTIEWRNLTVGSQYILFLQEADDHYKLTYGVEAAFQISHDGAMLKPLAGFDESQRPYAVVNDAAKYTPYSFKAFVRNQVAAEKK